jgi:hypothetical protein
MMRQHDFYDFTQRHGFMWMKGWRCHACGQAANPIAAANRRLGLVEHAMRIVATDPTNTMLSVRWHYGS